MLGNSKRVISFNLMAGICVLALSAGWSVSRAQDSITNQDKVNSEARQEASAVTDAKVSAPVPDIAAPEPRSTEPQAVSATTGEPVTPLNPVEVKPVPKSGVNTSIRPYYIEFRARAAYNYGHAFVVHGRVGEPLTKRSVVGLHPIGENPTSWIVGHVIFVPSETGWSDGDIGYNDRYITSKYRVYLTEAEYRVVTAKLREMQNSSPVWHAAVYNCVAFVGDIAAFLGMQHPGQWVMPKEYIDGIRSMNGGRQELPSRWLEAVNPRLAAQQAAQLAHAQHATPQTEQAQEQSPRQQTTASTTRSSASNSRRQHATAAAASAAAPVPSSYAGVR